MLIETTFRTQGKFENTTFVSQCFAKVKYDTIGRHYFAWNYEKKRFERIGLKGLAAELHMPSIELASKVKELQVLQEQEDKRKELQEQEDKRKELQRSYDNAKNMLAYFAAMHAQYPKHEVIKAQEVYTKSYIWRLGHLLNIGIEEVKEDILASIRRGIGNLKEPQGAMD